MRAEPATSPDHLPARAAGGHRRPALWRRTAILVLSLAAGAVWAAASEPEVTLNFREADIAEVISVVADITGKTIILDSDVQGKVTVVSSQPLAPAAVWETFLAILEVNGFAAVESAGTVKIIQEQNFRTQPGAETGGRRTVAPDDVVTRVVALTHVPAAQVVPPLRPLASQYGHLAAYPSSNMLIISDRAANVERLIEIVRRIDRAGEQDMEVVSLEHASASDLVRVITALRQGVSGAEGGGQVALVADERTNSILLSGDRAERLRVKTLIAHLDTPLSDDDNTQVTYLQYADAEALAETLRNFVSGQLEGQRASGGEGQSGASGSGNSATILPDKDTNALVITAPQKMMRSIQSIVSKLDIRRAQVLVEAILVEITSDRSSELGITWAIDNTDSGSAGFTDFSGTGAGLAGLAAAAQGGEGGVDVPDGGTFGVGRVRDGGMDYAALLRALAGDSTTNILSTPSLVTLDNEEASFSVGQEVPFVTGQFTNTGSTGGSVNPFQTVQREEVGIKLNITPKINEGNSVRLKIEQEASSLSSGSSSAVDLITNKREIATNVIVDSGDIIVLGGLIDDTVRENEQRVPGLGSIPLLGNLFKYRKSSKVKRNLMVFIRPVILRDSQQAINETNAKYRYILEQQDEISGGDIDLLPGQEPPRLEEFEPNDRAGPVGPEPADDGPEDEGG